MASFGTSETGMTVIRQNTPGAAPGAGLSAPATPSATQSGGGNPLSQTGSPYETQTTPTSTEPIRKAPPPTPGAAADVSDAGRAGETPAELAPQPVSTEIVHANQGKIRSMPVSEKLAGVLQTAAVAAGVDQVRITSGGQPAKGTVASRFRTGSTRHDLGNAADLQLVKNGRTLDFENPQDRLIFETFIKTAVGAGAVGIGAGPGYMGPTTTKIHVGFGTPAYWGRGTRAVNAPAWVVDAWTDGRANPVTVAPEASVALALVPPDPRTRPEDPFGIVRFQNARAEVDVPSPPMRPDLSQPAVGARGAAGPIVNLEIASPPVTINLGEAVIDNRRVVERGWRGAAVAELQEFLAWRGIAVGGIDGVYGRQTRNAVREFQRQSDIQTDGRVGPETLQAILYDIDPSSAVMPGDAAYRIGKRSAERIVSPGSTEVDIPLPRPRPAREVDIPRPRPNPRTQDLRTWLRTGMEGSPEMPSRRPGARLFAAAERQRVLDEIEAWKQRGATQPGTEMEGTPEAPSRRPGAKLLAPEERQKVLDEIEAWKREMVRRDAAKAADLATEQRITGAAAGQRDRYRLQPDSLHIGVGSDAVRAAEAIREMARGIGDAYRDELERQTIAATLAEQSDPAVREAGALIEQEALAAEPTAANTVTGAYVFGPAGDSYAMDAFRRTLERRRALESRQLARDRARGRTVETGNSPVPSF